MDNYSYRLSKSYIENCAGQGVERKESETDKELLNQLLSLLMLDEVDDSRKAAISEIIFLISSKKDDNISEMIEHISKLLDTCDIIPIEIKNSLEERLEIMNKEERKRILSLYPSTKQGTGKDKRYRCRPYVGGKNDKREVCKPTLEEAEDEIIRRHKASEMKAMTLWEALVKYDEDRDDICDSTKVHHEQDMKRFAGKLLYKPINEITAIEIQKAYVSAVIETNATKKACNNFKGILRRVFKHAQKHYGCEVIDINDCIYDLNTEVNRTIFKKAKNPVLFSEHTDHYLYEEAVEFLMEAFRRNTLESLAASEVFFTGKRISEVAGMYKSDLNLDNRLIHLQHAEHVNKRTNEYFIGLPKGDKIRNIVIPECAVPYYRRVLELSDPDSPYLFPDDNPLNKCDWMARHIIDSEIADICETIGIVRKSAHDMRRTYDSMLDEASMPSALRHLLVGHELTGIEANYLRDTHSIKEVQEIINVAFNKFYGEGFMFE